MTIQPASQCHGLYACSDLSSLMERSIQGTRGDVVNLHGADVFQDPEDKDLPLLPPHTKGDGTSGLGSA